MDLSILFFHLMQTFLAVDIDNVSTAMTDTKQLNKIENKVIPKLKINYALKSEETAPKCKTASSAISFILAFSFYSQYHSCKLFVLITILCKKLMPAAPAFSVSARPLPQ